MLFLPTLTLKFYVELWWKPAVEDAHTEETQLPNTLQMSSYFLSHHIFC